MGGKHEIRKKKVSGGLHGGRSVTRAVAVAGIDHREVVRKTSIVWSIRAGGVN